MTCQDMVWAINNYLSKQLSSPERYVMETKDSCVREVMRDLQANNLRLLEDCLRREGMPEMFIPGAVNAEFYRRI
jgi:hypothetical protein